MKIQENDVEDILIKALAAYVLNHSQKPVCEVIESLFEVELKAAQLIAEIDHKQPVNLHQTLSRVYSFIPIKTQSTNR